MSKNRRKAVKRTDSEWAEISCNWESSGLLQSKFCDREGLSPSAFYKHRNRFVGNDKSIEYESRLEPVKFVESKLPKRRIFCRSFDLFGLTVKFLLLEFIISLRLR